MTPFPLTFSFATYTKARDTLGLSLLQEFGSSDEPHEGFNVLTLKPGTLGGGKETGMYDQVCFLDALPNNKGVPFLTLQTSYEDAQGISSMQDIGQFGKGFPQSLISLKAARAILILDFWNPIYSWRRGILMYYIPNITSLSNNIYDLGSNFIAAVRNSTPVINKDVSSPEYQFLQLYDGSDDVEAYQMRFSKYLTIVNSRISTPDGLLDYLKLAESRRRIYHPLPLDEFGVQLPYAVNLPLDWAYVEMTEQGQIQSIPQRGLDFFKSWTESLSGYDPHLLPTITTNAAPRVPRAVASRCLIAKDRPNGTKKAARATRKETLRLMFPLEPSTSSTANPTWNDDVAALFSKPYWVASPSQMGSSWTSAMRRWSPPSPASLYLDLSNSSSVQANVVTIYQHLRSKSMPITSDPTEYWPDTALETFRLWANQGFRTTSSDPVMQKQVIPTPVDPPVQMRVRKDIINLQPDELQTYREKLDDVLQVQSLSSKWQELGFLRMSYFLFTDY